ncbi:c-type cytochrome [uncultured Cardiobacterium sp.]|uniref:c-type cytochrome n=1 Tax=uncultured Cardiobacterium sp. TaxID=417619 RepID=UPI00262CFB61|nr:c-type cytochrome [uncultured Cardiobacterium sp.]
MTQNIPQKTKLIMVILALFMPAFLVLPLVIWGGDTAPPAINKDLQAARLAPVGVLTVGKVADNTAVATAPAPADATPAVAAVDSAPAFDAAGTYKTVCSACHDNLPNAPKPSDTAAWQARLDKAGSLDALVKNGIQGTAGGMPPKGGSALDDGQFHDMVVYMLDHAKVAHGAAPAPADNAAAPAPADSAAAPADNAAAPTPADSAPAVAAAPAFDAAGTYKASCAACHDNLPNAPKPSDTAGWQARLDKAGSLDALVKSGIQGTAGGMPPKGGSALDDAQFHDMVVYMLDQAKVSHGAAPAPADNAAAPADSAAAPADNAAAPAPADSAPAVAAAPAFDAAGTYKASCAACHDNLPNAPKPSDTAAWQARLDKAGSLDALVKSGIQGTAGGMPPRGGSALNDAQFHDMVVYMLDHAKVAH